MGSGVETSTGDPLYLEVNQLNGQKDAKVGEHLRLLVKQDPKPL
jgi:hypothetical protein